MVDDCSTDGSAEIAESAGARVIRQERRGGPNAARNAAIAVTEQEWVAFLDSDDEWMPDHLARAWEIRGAHSLIAMAHVQCRGDVRPCEFAGPLGPEPFELAAPDQAIFPGNLLATSATLARTAALRAAGGFPQRRRAGDLALWCRILARETGVASPTPTVVYHGHAGQMTSDLEPTFQAYLDIARRCYADGSIAARTLRRARGKVEWDRVGVARASGDRRAVARSLRHIARHPHRVEGMLLTAVRRRRLRQRSKLLPPPCG